MKKVVRKLNRVLSVLLTAAMVVGSVPEAGFTVKAAGLESETETEVQGFDGQDTDDQNLDDQDTGDQDMTDSQNADDQDAGDDQATDDQDASDDQSNDSTPSYGGNTEGDTQSETTPVDTTDGQSDDNTAGEEEVQAEDGITPKDGEDGNTGDGDGEGDASQTTTVTVTPATPTVEKGGTQTFTATVTTSEGDGGTDSQANEQVTWTIEGTVVDGTKIEADEVNGNKAVLTVAESETATTLTVKATVGEASGTATVTVKEPDAPVIPDTSVQIALAEDANEALAKNITYVVSAQQTARPDQLINYKKFGGDDKAEKGAYLYVKVPNVDAEITMDEDAVECYSDNSFIYYEYEVNDTIEVSVDAKVEVTVTPDVSSRIESVTITEYEAPKENTDEETQTLSLERSGRALTTDDADYGKAYNIVVTAADKSAITGISIDSNKKTAIQHNNTTNTYTVENAFTANGRIDVQIKSAKASEVIFQENDGEDKENSNFEIKYAFNKEMTVENTVAKNTDSDVTINFAGDLYFKPAVDGKEILKVVAVNFDEDGDETDEVPLDKAADGVYKINITEKTLVKVITEEQYKVTIEIANGNNDIESYSWARSADAPSAEWTKVSAENADDQADEDDGIPVTKGDSIFLKVKLAASADKKRAKVTVGGREIDPMDRAGEEIFEIKDDKDTKVEIASDTAYGSGKENVKLTLGDATVESKDILLIRYKESGEDWVSLAKTGTAADETSRADEKIYNFENDKLEVTLGKYYDIEITLDDEAAESAYVKSITVGSGSPVEAKNDGAKSTARVRITDATPLTIGIGVISSVKLTRDEAAADTVGPVKYWIGDESEKPVTFDDKGTFTIHAKEGEVVSLAVTAKPGNKATVKDSENNEPELQDGVYKITVGSTSTELTISTEASADITFAVKDAEGEFQRGKIEKVEWQLVKTGENLSNWENLPIPKEFKKTPTRTITLTETEGKDLYFKVEIAQNAKAAVKEVKNGSDTIPQVPEQDYYKIESAKILDGTTIDIITVAEYTVTLNKEIDTDEDSPNITLEKGADEKQDIADGGTNELIINAGDSYKFILTYDKAKAKIDGVTYTNAGEKEPDKDAIVEEEETDETGKTTVTYTLSPKASGTLTIKAHDKENVALNFTVDDDATTVQAATSKEKVEDASLSTASDKKIAIPSLVKEDDTLYFSITAPVRYKAAKVEYEIPAEDGESEPKWKSIDADADGIYELPLTNVTDEQNIHITTVRDAKLNNEVTFKGDLDGVEIGIGDDDEELGGKDSRESIGETAYTEAATLDFTVKTKKGYYVNKITIGGEEVTTIKVDGTDKTLDEVDFSNSQTIKVDGMQAVDATGSNKTTKEVDIRLVKKSYEKDVYFKVVSETGVYADVTTSANIVKAKYGNNVVYKAEKGTEEAEIKVQVPAGSTAPSLKIGQDSGASTVPATGNPNAITGTGRVEYTFTVMLGNVANIGTSSLNSPAVITVSTEAPTSSEPKYNATITVNRDVEDVAVAVRLMKEDDKTRVALSADYTEETVTYTTGDEDEKALYENDTYILYAEIAENHGLSSDIPGFSFYKTEKGRNVYRAYITKVSADIVGTITPKADIVFTMKKTAGGVGSAAAVEPVKGIYAAAKNDVFEVTFKSGRKDGVFTGDKAKVSGITIAEDDNKTLVVSDNKITFTVPGDAKKGKVTLTVYYGSDAHEDFVLDIADTIKSVKITGTGVKNNAVTQKLDTVAAYKVTGVKDFSTLRVESSAAETKDGVTGVVMTVSEIDDQGNFTVTSSNAADQASVITITSTAEKEPKEEGSSELVSKILATLTVTTAEENLEIKSITQKAVLDNRVVLTAAPKDAKLQKPATFGLMYKVEVAQDQGTGAPTLTSKTTQYFDVAFDSNGKVQPTDLNVILSDSVGKAWGYTLKVTLVEGTKNAAGDITGTPVVTGVAKDVSVTTKDPYYEEKLALTKKTTTVYTGQSDITVAIPKFGKNTTYQEKPGYGGTVQIFDKNGYPVTNGGFITARWDTDTNEIKVSVARNYWDNVEETRAEYSYNDVMAYTLKVIPEAGKRSDNTTVEDTTTTNMYAMPATLKITVVQGIERLGANGGYTVNEARKIYKQSGKAASYNMELTYNGGEKNYKPKTAKAEYTLGTYDAYGNFVEADAELQKLITVKNGKISINKSYAVSSDTRENVFAVRVNAVDYSGNTTQTTEVYEVTGEAATLGTIYFTNQEDNKYYVISKDAKGVTEMTMDQLWKAEPIVLRTGVAEGQKYYTVEDILTENTDYTITYNNNKIGKNQTITAAVRDGSKTKKVTAKYTVNYNTEELGIESFNQNDSRGTVSVLATGKNIKGAYTYEYQSNSVDDTIEFYVGYRKDNVLTYNLEGSSGRKYNYSVSVSGGAILNSNYDSGYYNVLPAKKDMTITLTDKGSGKAVKTTYVLTNNGFVTAAAPKVAVKGNSFYEGLDSDVDLTITKNGKYDVMYLSVDQKDYAKNYTKLSNSYNNINYGRQSAVGSMISLDTSAASETIQLYAYQRNAGTYKYNVTFGTRNEDSEFVPLTKAVSIKVTVKAVAAYKPAAKYTVDQKVGYVALTGSPADYTYSAYENTKIENANVKGGPNNFDKFFTIDKVNGAQVLRISANVKIGDTTYDTPEKISEYLATKEGKDDLTGYVYYWNPKTRTTEASKITVSLKNNAYTAAPISHILDSNGNLTNATTTVKCGKDDIRVAAAYIKNEEDATVFTAKVSGLNNTVTVSTTARPEKTAYKATIYVVPVGSSYAELFAEGKNPTLADYEKYGVPTQLKITIVDPKKGKIIFKDKKVLTQIITEDQYETDVATRTTVDKANLYKTVIGFDVLPGAKVTGIELENKEDTPYLTISKVPDTTVDNVETINNKVLITVDRDKLKAANDAATPANAKKPALYGAKKAYKAVVTFAQGEAETVTFNITMPTPQTYAEALAAVQAAEENQNKRTNEKMTFSVPLFGKFVNCIQHVIII